MNHSFTLRLFIGCVTICAFFLFTRCDSVTDPNDNHDDNDTTDVVPIETPMEPITNPEDIMDSENQVWLDSLNLNPQAFQTYIAGLSDRDDFDTWAIIVKKDDKIIYRSEKTSDEIIQTDAFEDDTQVLNDERVYNGMSMTKSTVGLLLSVANQNGLLGDDGFSTSIFEMLGESGSPYKEALLEQGFDDSDLSGLTWTHFLSMASGLENVDSYRGNHDWLFDEKEGILFQTSKEADPGAIYYYSSSNTQVLGHLFTTLTGQTLAEYADDHLFADLEITNYRWKGYPYGDSGSRDDAAIEYNDAASGLLLRPDDWLKLIDLVTHDGKHDAAEVLDAESIANLANPTMGFDPDDGDDISYYTRALMWRKRYNLPDDIEIDYDQDGEIDDHIRVISFTGKGGKYAFGFPGWGLSIVVVGEEMADGFSHRDMQEPIVEGALRSLITSEN